MALGRLLSSHAVLWLSLLSDASVKAALVFAAAAGASLLLRRASAAWRHQVWMLAVWAALGLPALSLLLPAWRMRPVSPVLGRLAPAAVEQKATDQERAITPASAPRTATPPVPEAASGRGGGREVVTRAAGGGAAAEEPGWPSVPVIILVVWAAGALAALTPFVMGTLQAWGMVHRSAALGDEDWARQLGAAASELGVGRARLRLSPEEVVPMVWGWVRPTVVVPASAEGWTRERTRLVLLHELAHVKRGDCLLQAVAQVVCAVYWCNPLVWLAARRLRCERERACDDLVLAGGLKASVYAEHLVELARNLRPAGMAGVAAVPMARRAGLLPRVRDLLDSERSRSRVSRRGAAVSALALLALLAPLARVPTFAAETPAGHRPGLREQWQPQTEDDPRLQQAVHIEILGRAVVPALKLLSEKTDVSLAVAPEDLETVGERKLTIIAQGCSLKALLVQIPQALQECHVDIDTSGKEPAYLLHRNANAGAAMAQGEEADARRTDESRRPERAARVEAARKALAMSPAELAELAKTDPLLAAWVKDPEHRKDMELFFSLPPALMEQFVAEGSLQVPYASAPARFQAVGQEMLQHSLEWARNTEGQQAVADLFAHSLQQQDGVALCYRDLEADTDGLFGVLLDTTVSGPDAPGVRTSGGRYWEAIPPRFPMSSDEELMARDRELLVSTGTLSETAADAALANLAKRRDEEARAERKRRRELEWREPHSAALHKVVTLPFEGAAEPVDIQRFVAKESGLSVVSDYFTSWAPQVIPAEARTPQPLWRLLYLLDEASSEHGGYVDWSRGYEWSEAGDCLVFHYRAWYERVPRECPESVIASYREKLKQHGGFTLDDVAAFAAEMQRRKSAYPELGGKSPVVLPNDLRRAGLPPDRYYLDSPALLLYAVLSPEQQQQARSTTGLPYAAMTPLQRDLVLHSRENAAEASQAVYRVAESNHMGQVTEGGGAVAKMVKFDQCKLALEFPSGKVGTELELWRSESR